jgi:hypothetical protein
MTEPDRMDDTSTPPRRLRDTLDLLVALAALATSVVSIWLAISQGDDMRRLVQAQSWPYIGFHSGNSSLDPASNQRIRSLSFSVENLGVGPAKLRWLEIMLDGKAQSGHDSLIRGSAGLAPDAGYDGSAVYSVPVGGRVLRAGETITYLRWDRGDGDNAAWEAFDHARFGRLTMRACFCSVFDECWISASNQQDARPVAHCPTIATPYRE